MRFSERFKQFIFPFFLIPSHAINLLNNLPVSCLDVLIDVPVQGGLEKHGGKNVDAVQVLIDFMEKRIDKVKFILCSVIQRGLWFTSPMCANVIWVVNLKP